MESSTQPVEEASPEQPEELEHFLANWAEIEQRSGVDLERTAKETKALLRKRGVQSAGDLLRMILCYVLTDWSLRLVAAWAVLQRIACLSDVAVMNRLRNSHRWLGKLIGAILQQRCQGWQAQGGVRIRLIDATVISQPGSRGTDWRVHLSFDLEQVCLDGVEVTDAHGGESLARFPPQTNEIQVADSGYAFSNSLAGSLAAGVGVVVRTNGQNLVLETKSGARFPLVDWLKDLSGPQEQSVWLSTPQGRFALRLLACPLPLPVAERTRRRVRQRNAKKGRQVKAHTLFLAGYGLLVTNLPALSWPLARIFGLYRLRWQIELHIKRLKSLLCFDHLRSQDPHLAQTYLLGKLLAALLLDQLTQQVHLQQPDWFVSLEHPLSAWRLTTFLWDTLRHLVVGPLSLARFVQVLPALHRYFCDSPRARPQQLAWARAFLEHANASPAFFGC